MSLSEIRWLCLRFTDVRCRSVKSAVSVEDDEILEDDYAELREFENGDIYQELFTIQLQYR